FYKRQMSALSDALDLADPRQVFCARAAMDFLGRLPSWPRDRERWRRIAYSLLSPYLPFSLSPLLFLSAGCTTLHEWVHNDFKVGPNYQEPPATVAKNWIDAGNPHIITDSADTGAWWGVFKDPQLDSLIETAYRENLDLKTAATRVLQAQAQRNIAAGNL